MYANMTLGDLIDWLEKQDQDLIVKDGFGDPHSDRGSYDELAFCPKTEAKISDMLYYAKFADGNTFQGWKGGEFKMNRGTPVYIGEWGDCGEEITTIHFKYWLLTGNILKRFNSIVMGAGLIVPREAVKLALKDIFEAINNDNTMPKM